MLEKTAASLEPCGFQRVVPGATQSFRSTRQLRTAFWRHGAADLELTNAWQALMHGTSDLIDSPPEENRDSVLSASTFLLDFLYPSGAISLMRRLTPITPASRRSDSFRYSQRLSKLAPRLYTSSLPRGQDHRAGSEPVTSQKPLDADTRTLVDETAGTRTKDHEDGENDRHSHTWSLNWFLDKGSPESAGLIWYHYKALDEPLQNAYMRKVLLFLSKSGRLSDSLKVSELFHKIPLSSWTNDVFVAGVAAETKLENVDRALEIFVKGLRHQDLNNTYLVDALDLLLSNALRSPTWQILNSVWKHYSDMAAWLDFDGITSQLKHVASVPELAVKALQFQFYGRSELESAELDQEALDVLQRILVRRALVSCTDTQVIPLLNTTKDPLAFEEFLRQVTSKGQGELGLEVYQIYRDLPGSLPSHAVLHEMERVFRRFNFPISTKYTGYGLLWEDWHKFHTTPSRRAFQRYMSFYASQGDTQRVYDIWTEYIELRSDDPDVEILQGDDTFAHLLQVHAVRGEVDETQRIFNFISEKFGIEPNVYSWNILLNAYVKAGDYEGAVSTFDDIATVGKADNYSYGTMMQMAGERGDLGYTIDLYRRAVGSGVRVDEAILNSLIDAYCQNNYIQAAEDVCVRAVRKGIATTRMWNKLIHHYALRRDLAAMNKTLEAMAQHNIPYNQFTYLKLLTGLSLCQQSQHALSLLASALKDDAFDVTADHFHIVMGSLLRTREPEVVKRLHKLMNDYGFASTSESMLKLTQTLAQWNNLPPAQRERFTSSEWLDEALHSFNDIYDLNDITKLKQLPSARGRHSRTGKLLEKRTENIHFSAMVFMFSQMKDFFGAQQLIDLYRLVFRGQDDSDAALPIAMLNSIMLMDFQEGHHNRVRETWVLLVEAVKKEAQSADDVPSGSKKISPRYRYILSNGLEVMQQMFFTLNDAAGLQRLIREVRFDGFEIDSKNWNYYVQSLAQLKQHKVAFLACEKMLMPNWTGWFVIRSKENMRNNISLDQRRKGRSRRYLRPTATTLYHLAHSYVELDHLSVWSAESAQELRQIEEECPQVVRAIKSMKRVYSQLEHEIFDREDHVDIDAVDADAEQDEGGYQTRSTNGEVVS